MDRCNRLRLAKWSKSIAIVVGAYCVAALALWNASLAADTNRISILKLTEIANQRSIEWVWYADKEVLKKQPHWNGYSLPAPLPAHTAASGAMKQIKESHAEITKWKFESIGLRPLEDRIKKSSNAWMESIWYYHIQLVPADEGEYDRCEKKGELATLSRVVLMDGTTLSPTINKGKNPKD